MSKQNELGDHIHPTVRKIRGKWCEIDANEPLGDMIYPVCGANISTEIVTDATARIFAGGILKRYGCSKCGTIVGPAKNKVG